MTDLDARLLMAVVALFLFTGCASGLQNTLAQDSTWSAYQVCRAETGTNAVVQRVDPDGRYYALCPDHCARWPEFQSCMSAKRRAYLEEPAKRQRATTGSTPAPTFQGSPVITGPIAMPTWKVGSEWAYRYESPSGSGSFVWRLDRVEDLANEPHYVIVAGTRELFYRVADRGFTRENLDGKPISEVSPPASWKWVAFPLAVGLSWDMRYRETRPTELVRETIERRCVAEAEEAVTVPAGTFATIRVVCKNPRTDAWVSTMWYSPEVTHMVKDEFAARTGGRTSRELLMFRLK
jgi:hypothetical protein